MSINNCMFGGIVVDQPTERGAAVCVKVKTWRSYNGRTFFTKNDVEAYGGQKDAALQLRPGQSVICTGNVETRSYESQGTKKWKTAMNVRDISTSVQFLDPDAGHQQQQYAQPAQQQAPQPPPPPQQYGQPPVQQPPQQQPQGGWPQQPQQQWQQQPVQQQPVQQQAPPQQPPQGGGQGY